MSDSFYDCTGMSEEALRETFVSWDVELTDKSDLRYYHAIQVRQCASLQMGETVLDVGCGECHLYDVLGDKVKGYVGVDIDPRILKMAREKHPELDLRPGNIYDLSGLGVYDTVYAIGVYFNKPNLLLGVVKMLEHARLCVVMTYFTGSKREPFPLLSGVEYDYLDFELDPESTNTYIANLEIVRIRKK